MVNLYIPLKKKIIVHLSSVRSNVYHSTLVTEPHTSLQTSTTHLTQVPHCSLIAPTAVGSPPDSNIGARSSDIDLAGEVNRGVARAWETDSLASWRLGPSEEMFQLRIEL